MFNAVLLRPQTFLSLDSNFDSDLIKCNKSRWGTHMMGEENTKTVERWGCCSLGCRLGGEAWKRPCLPLVEIAQYPRYHPAPSLSSLPSVNRAGEQEMVWLAAMTNREYGNSWKMSGTAQRYGWENWESVSVRTDCRSNLNLIKEWHEVDSKQKLSQTLLSGQWKEIYLCWKTSMILHKEALETSQAWIWGESQVQPQGQW